MMSGTDSLEGLVISKVIAIMIDMSSFSYEYIYNRIVADEIPILLQA